MYKSSLHSAGVAAAVILASLSTATTVPAAQAGSAGATVDVGTLPMGLAVAPDGGTVYVTTTDTGLVAVDPKTKTVTQTFTVGNYPTDVGIANDGRTAFTSDDASSSRSGAITRVDLTGATDNYMSSGGVGPLLRVTVGPDTAYFPDNSCLILTASIAQPTQLLDSFSVTCKPTDLALSTDGKSAYVTSLTGSLDFVDMTNESVTKTIDVASSADAITLASTPSGRFAYIASQSDGTVVVVDLSAQAVTDTINVGNSPQRLVASPNGERVYVTNTDDGSVSVIQTTDNTVIDTISVGTKPVGVATSNDGGLLFVANSGDGTVSIIPLSGLPQPAITAQCRRAVEQQGRNPARCEGETVDVAAGSRIVAMVKLPGQTRYSPDGTNVKVRQDGTFTWSSGKQKRVLVYFRLLEDPKVRSPRERVPAS